MERILQHLKHHGEQLDTEIAAAIGLPVAKVRATVDDLSAKGDVIVCRSIRYQHGKPTEGVLCRLSGYTPPASPGRKAKAKTVSG